MDMQFHTRFVNTVSIPETHRLLQQYLPSIFNTACFNEKSLPFSKEASRTELGHLFEHILIDMLCIEKRLHGFPVVSYSGRTVWDWMTEPYGSFHVTIEGDLSDPLLFISPIRKSIDLMEKILSTCPNTCIEEKSFARSFSFN